MKAHKAQRILSFLAMAAATVVMLGCPPPVGVKATIRTDERTRLEREILGERAAVSPRMVLLPLEREREGAVPQAELRRLHESYVELERRLAALGRHDAALRAWQAISLHNRGVLQARLGATGEAVALLEEGLGLTRQYGLAVLEWQMLMTRGALAEETQQRDCFRSAAETLLAAPLLSELDYALEGRQRRERLYAWLLGDALGAGEEEEALRYALEQEAVELARAMAPGEFSLPAGELRELARELAEARAAGARARDEVCNTPLSELQQDSCATVQAFGKAKTALEEVRERIRASSPAGGLFVPDPVDGVALHELLSEEAALLLFAPAGGDAYAAFLLGPTFKTAEVRLAPFLVEQASVAGARGGQVSPKVLSAAAGALLGPFAQDLEGGVEQLYLACPPELSGLAWQSLPFGEGLLSGRFRLAFLGGPSDLYWAFRQKTYGRESLLVCCAGAGECDRIGAWFADRTGISFFDVQRTGKSALPDAAAFVDNLWFSGPLEIMPASPTESHLVFPGELELLSGVTAGELCTYRTAAGCVGFARVEPMPFETRSFAALRVFTRAVIAAGVPSLAYGAACERMPDEVRDGFWLTFLEGVRRGSAAEAYGRALAAVEARWREAFRLYGFAGMTAREVAEYSKLEFNDVFRSASAHLAAGRHQEAAAGFLDLARMAEALQAESEAQKALRLARIQEYLVACMRKLRRYDLAARHQRLLIDSLDAYGQTPGAVMAAQYQSLGAVLTEGERFEDAAAAYGRSIELMGEHGGEERVARLLGELAKSLDRAAEYGEALATFQQALEKYRQLQQQGGVATQHQRIGTLYLNRLNDVPRAEENFREALRLFQASAGVAGTVGATVDIGICRRAVGDFDGALGLFAAARQKAEAEGLRDAVARALTETANTQWLRGEYQEALALVGQSNEIATELDSAFQLNVNHQLLGLIYWELNQYDRAHRALDVAIEEAWRAQRPLEVASAYNNRGIVYRRSGQYAKALEMFEQALAIDRRLRTRWGQAYDHRNIGMTLHRMGSYEEASGHMERAVALAGEIGDRVSLARALLALGDLRLDEGRLAEAEPLLQKALEESRAVVLPEVEWRALESLGRLLRRRGEDAAALDAFEKGVEVVERLRGMVKTEEFRSGFLTNKMDLYEDTVALLLDMDRPEEAFTYSERSRARKFIDILAQQAFELGSDRERELYARQQELSRQMRAVREALAREEDAGRRSEVTARLQELQRRYSDLLVDIRVANPALSSFVTVEVPGPRDLAQVLPDDVSLVVYYAMKDELAIWVWRQGRLAVRRVAVSRDELAQRIKTYRLMVQNREMLDDVQEFSKGLDGVLVGPVRDLIEGSRAVGIVPHRGLHYLSFASLYDGEAFLVERYPLFYSPSASLLGHFLRGEPPSAKAELQVLAIGNPRVGSPAYELPFTEREVVSVERDFVNVTALTGEKATEEWVKQNISRFDVVHFGAHGHFDPVNPLFSSLRLAPQQDDGILHLHEVMGLEIGATLVTLSACQSGLGDLRSADELVSLSRAFTYAGTRSILSTLWRVDDVSTALVTKHFYRHYVDHGAAESLRHAQLQVMNDGRHYHPTYWGGVILTGDYR